MPPPVASGGTIGVVAPGGAVNEEALAAGVAALETMGYRVRLGAHVLDRHRFYAGRPEVRLSDLTAMIADADIGAVICARGGHGTTHVLEHLDPALFTANPKLVVGYSDVSPLLGWIVERCGVVAIHGPMIATDLARGVSERTAARLRALLAMSTATWREAVPETLRPGAATGRLVGGCLSSIVALLGTPWAIETDGAVLFLEDVGERPFRIDRMLTHLRLAGKLDRVVGVVLGAFADRDGSGGEDEAREVFQDFFANVSIPVVSGFPAGHLSENLPLALGVPVRVDADAGFVEALAA